VERANRTFKRQLGALQAQKGQSDWVALLLELALVINTTSTRALPRNKTPYEVWFGRKPRWITAQPTDEAAGANDVDEELIDDSDDESGDDEDPVLTEIEARVVANDARLRAQMIKANSGRSAAFIDRAIATLQIPLKLRLATEPSRLPIRVLEYKNGQYKLQCRHGRLTGRYQGGELNPIDAATAALVGRSIQTKPEQKGTKEVTIKLPSAVAKENNRGTITSAQKAGRTTKSRAKPDPKPRRKPGPKPRTKRNQTEAIAIDDDAGNDGASNDDAGEPVQLPKSRAKRKRMEVEDGGEDPSPRRLRKRV
jgi:hypothetical protein